MPGGGKEMGGLEHQRPWPTPKVEMPVAGYAYLFPGHRAASATAEDQAPVVALPGLLLMRSARKSTDGCLIRSVLIWLSIAAAVRRAQAADSASALVSLP